MSSADRYEQLLARASVREWPPFQAPPVCSELELQARWFAGDFGRAFTTVDGRKLEVVQFGVWNREAGPDFSDAAVRIGDELTRGSIEFDLADQNWETHGHSANPAFDDTALHVFVHGSERAFFSRTSQNRNVPQVRVDPSALSGGSTNFPPLARPGRCQAPLRDLAEEKIGSILEAAAQYRLDRKSLRLQRLIEIHGLEESLFGEVAATLGYKQNKLPFTLLAQRLSLGTLRQSLDDAEAVLFGVAGFLNSADLARFKEGTRNYLRTLWDRWWPRRSELERFILPADTWRISGTRPLNHPHRRLGALAALVAEWPSFLQLSGKRELRPLRDFFSALAHPYWNFYYTVTSAPSAAAMALIGETRLTEILANVILPLWQLGSQPVWPQYLKLRAGLSNRRVETAATRLFGPDRRRPQFLRHLWQQQALLQIYEDFCLPDHSDCAHCPFPEQMLKWT